MFSWITYKLFFICFFFFFFSPLFRKQTIHSEKTFDFLRDLVVNVPDHQPDEEGDGNSSSVPSCSSSSAQEGKKPKVPRHVTV